MLFKAVIYSTSHKITVRWINNAGNWFNVNGRSYRKDREAVCQVVGKDGQLKGVVEALYIEGNPIPFRSSLNAEEVTLEHLEELMSESTNDATVSFWDKIFGS